MTHDQADLIIRMRKDGYSFAAIADSIARPVSTIKSYCQRNDVQSPPLTGRYAVNSRQRTCAHCGKPLVEAPKRKPRRFCSDACCNKWWRACREERDSDASVRHTCAACGRVFMRFRSQQGVYCSRACYHSKRFEVKTDAVSGSV